jgi:competence protein ComEC
VSSLASARLWLRAHPHALVGATCLGVAAANAVRPGWPALALAIVLVAAALGSSANAVVRAGTVLAALVLAGLWWGGARLDALDRSALRVEVGRSARALVTVTGPSRRGPFGIRAPADASRFGRLALDEPVLLKLPLGRAPPQGARLEAIASVELPRTAADGFDERGWLRRQGVHVVLRVHRWHVVDRRGGLGGVGDRLRARLSESMAPGLEGERRAVIAGIVLGADEGLSDELRERFRAAGLYHLLAVSGQNVALVAIGVLMCAWLAGIPRWLGEIGALGAIVGYVLAVGAQPSVVRAGVAGVLASLAWLTARERDRWYFLLLGALVLLAWNPYVLRDPGFQLSFTAVAAIFVLVPRLQRALEGYPVPRRLGDVAAVAAACGVVTAPILWLQFHAIPLLTVPANALAAPAVAPLLGLALGAAALDSVAPSAAVALAWLNGWCAAYLAGCARLVGAIPFAQVRSTTGLVALAAFLVGAVLLVRLGQTARVRAVVALGVGVLALAGWHLRASSSPAPPQGLRITFLDVGQGDAVLLQAGSSAVLVDQGPPEADVAAQLRGLGVRRIAVLVLTHPQRDHVGGAPGVLSRLRVDLVLDPRLRVTSPDESTALAAARAHHVRVLAARAGQVLRLGMLRLRVLWPDGPGQPGEDPNDRAIVIHATYGRIDALLTADAESDVVLPLRPPRAEILKVAHHGSADPALAALLERVRPRVAVISVGSRNDYGHPTASTLASLGAVPGLDLYRTDRDGRIVLESDGQRIAVEAAR